MPPLAKRILKITLIVFVVLVVLIGATAVILPMVINPNDYKDDIAKIVKDQTGRDLSIGGDIDLSVFPWLGAEIGDVSLSNAEGFKPADFARVKHVDVHVKLWPLLHKEIQVGRIEIDGLKLNLVRRADGSTNWDDLVKHSKAQTPAPEKSESGSGWGKLGVAGLTVSDASVTFTDAANSRQYKLDPFNLDTGSVAFGKPIPLQMNAVVSMTNPETRVKIDFDGSVNADPDTQRFVSSDSSLDLELSGSDIPLKQVPLHLHWDKVDADLKAQTLTVDRFIGEGLGAHGEINGKVEHLTGKPAADLSIQVPDFTPGSDVLDLLKRHLPEGADAKALAPFGFQAKVTADLKADTASISDLRLAAGPIQATGKVDVKALTGKPQASGRLQLQPFSPSEIVTALGKQSLLPDNPEALKRMQFETDFQGDADSVRLSNLKLMLDRTNVTGHAGITKFAEPAIDFALNVDNLNADLYLPAKSEKAPKAAAQGSIDDVKLPVKPLDTLNVDGKLNIGNLQAFGLKVSDIDLGLAAHDGLIKLDPAKAALYSGKYAGSVQYDVRGGVPRLGIDQTLSGIKLGDLLKDLFGTERLSGQGNVAARFTAKGPTIGALRRSLNGDASLKLHDGALEGANLWEAVKGAYAEVKGKHVDQSGTENRTRFTELSMSAKVTDGVAHNDDLKARLPFLAVTGKGDVNLVNESLDYHLRAKIIGSPEVEGLNNLKELNGVTIPVRLAGKFTDIAIRPDVSSALKQKAKAKARDAEDKAKSELEKKKKSALDKLKDRFGGGSR